VHIVRVKWVVVLLALSAVMVGLTGCGKTAPTAVPTVAATPAGGISGVVHVKDKDGYTFDVAYTYSPLRIEKSVANNKPGFSSALIRSRISLSVTNTTPGRNLTFAPFSGVDPNQRPYVALIATWSPTSPMCRDLNSLTETSEQTCSMWLGFGRIMQPLGPDETVELSTDSGGPGGGGVAGIGRIPDSSYEAVSTGLEHPDGYSIVYSATDAGRFSTLCDDTYGSIADLFSSPGLKKCQAIYPLLP